MNQCIDSLNFLSVCNVWIPAATLNTNYGTAVDGGGKPASQPNSGAGMQGMHALVRAGEGAAG